MEQLVRFLSYLLLLVFAPAALALKFDINAYSQHDAAKHERCIRNFVAKDQLVVVTAIVNGFRGDGQTLNLHVGAQFRKNRSEGVAINNDLAW